VGLRHLTPELALIRAIAAAYLDRPPASLQVGEKQEALMDAISQAEAVVAQANEIANQRINP